MWRCILRGGVTGIAAIAGLGQASAQMPTASTPAPAAAKSAEPVVIATIHGEPLHLDRVDAVIRNRFGFTPLPAAQTRQLRTEIAGEMIDDMLVRQFLTRYAPKVEPAEVEQYVKAFTASLTKQGKTFAGYLKETNQTEASVRENWSVMLQLNSYVRQKVTNEQLKQYYEANKDHFDGVEVKASHIVIRVGPTASADEKDAAKAKLQSVRADIASGKLAFAAAAKKYSQCPSAPEGGNLGFIPRRGGLMEESFCKAAFSLKVGELSEVIETEFGIHLIVVAERKPGTASTFEKVVEDVRDTFAEDFRTELVTKLRSQSDVRIRVP